MNKRITAMDVAKQAGVSRSAVSRTFTPGASVSEMTRDKVYAAAEALGYQPNAIARMLIRQSSDIIGIVMGDFANPFYPEVLEQLTERLQETGYRPLLFNVSANQQVDDVLPMALEYQVRALVVTSATLSSKLAEDCARSGTPLIFFNRTQPGTPAIAICCDNESGGRMAADTLLDAGYTRPAFLAGKANTSTNEERFRGFQARLKERGHDLVDTGEGHYTYREAYDATCDMLAGPDHPDAIFCANDIMAMGAIDAARYECALKVPEDIGILGFDDIPMSSWRPYQITTIRQPVNAMIDQVMRVIGLDDLQGDALKGTEIRVPGRLIRRGSIRSGE